nr:hypothetical protein Iba_chr02cCG10710 [Ipomoea batatas]
MAQEESERADDPNWKFSSEKVAGDEHTCRRMVSERWRVWWRVGEEPATGKDGSGSLEIGEEFCSTNLIKDLTNSNERSRAVACSVPGKAVIGGLPFLSLSPFLLQWCSSLQATNGDGVTRTAATSSDGLHPPLLGGAWCMAMVLVSGGGIVGDGLQEQRLKCCVLPASLAHRRRSPHASPSPSSSDPSPPSHRPKLHLLLTETPPLPLAISYVAAGLQPSVDLQLRRFGAVAETNTISPTNLLRQDFYHRDATMGSPATPMLPPPLPKPPPSKEESERADDPNWKFSSEKVAGDEHTCRRMVSERWRVWWRVGEEPATGKDGSGSLEIGEEFCSTNLIKDLTNSK